ncbi:MAG: phosphoribosylanthranilate isomerase [Gemmatimonadota bacterium]
MADRVRVKIDGVTRREDALAVERAGADYVGFILSPGFSRSVTLEEAATLVEGIGLVRIAVLVDPDVGGAEAAASAIDAGVIQLHGEEPPDLLATLRELGDWDLWKAVRARTSADVEEAVDRYADVADGILVEGWKEGVVGGGGVKLRVDPDAVRSLIPRDLDFILAGGLTPDTVAEAVAAFRPDVVDVSSGVERVLREKDHDLVTRFAAEARTVAMPSITAPTSAEEASR